MVERVCRLCFEEKPRSIGICTAIGVEMSIANAIRVHLADEVDESDHLPKLVCLDCWSKLQRFREFYNAVIGARANFLMTFIKSESPEFVEMNCDSVGHDDDAASVKDDSTLLPVFVITQIKSASLEWESNSDEDNFNSAVETTANNDRVGEEIPAQTDTIDHFEIGECSNGGIDTDADASEYDPKTDKEDEATACKDGSEIAEKRENTGGTARKSPSTSAIKVDRLIANYLDMVCEICDQPFGTLTEATSHYRSKHKRRTATAKCCQRRMRLHDMRSHIRYHLNPDSFKCGHCDKVCVTKSALDGHRRGHLNGPFECDICKKKITTKDSLQNHILRIHMNEKGDHECEICKKRFNSKNLLAIHVHLVHERRYERVCHICGKVFHSKHILLEHVRQHSDPNANVDCKICGKFYKNNISLRKHIKNIHEKDGRVYECPQCQKQFPKKERLRHHIAYHHNFKLQKCNICGKECKKAVELKEHMAIHTGIDLYTCNYCPRTFKANANKHKHSKRMHPDEWNAARKARFMSK